MSIMGALGNIATNPLQLLGRMIGVLAIGILFVTVVRPKIESAASIVVDFAGSNQPVINGTVVPIYDFAVYIGVISVLSSIVGAYFFLWLLKFFIFMFAAKK